MSDAAAQTVGAVATIVTQTADEAAVGSTEVVIGRQLHPAQAKAVERAERAAARLEQLEAEAEAKAARYRTESGSAAQETAPTAGSTVGSVGMGVELVAFLVAGKDLACSKSGPLSRDRQIWASS